jgi:hypothetical protein
VHQTFYIDINEEITSIVDRLRKAVAKEVIIVVPKRSILIQSIVNLKLLKKEADGLKKRLILVTQDKFGKMLIEKAGILVEQKLDDIGGEEIIGVEDGSSSRIEGGPSMIDMEDQELKKRLDGIGSDEYYQSESLEIISEKRMRADEGNPEKIERITNKELVAGVGEELKSRKHRMRAPSRKILLPPWMWSGT